MLSVVDSCLTGLCLESYFFRIVSSIALFWLIHAAVTCGAISSNKNSLGILARGRVSVVSVLRSGLDSVDASTLSSNTVDGESLSSDTDC